jgi:enoyl-CoA hydratase/carnithine racemase
MTDSATPTTSAPEDEILFEVVNHVGLITLNRPKALNALSHRMVQEMAARLDAWARDDGICAVVLRGAGDKAFCAGGDIKSLYQSWQQDGTLHHDFFIDEYRLDYQIHRYAKPFIALMDGIVMGGGMGLAQGASLRVVTERTRLAMPETGIGLMPDVGASHFLAHMQRELAFYLGITGHSILAADALFCSLADAYAPSAALADLQQTLAAIRWSGEPQADLYAALGASPEAPTSPPLLDIMPALYRHFSAPGVAATMQSLATETDPRYLDWAQKALKTMQTRSPLMMNVTRRQLLAGRRLDLADCFRMELGLVQHCFETGDFIEGVRALLVDKDNAPQWKAIESAEAEREMVDTFFISPWSRRQHPLAELGKH